MRSIWIGFDPREAAAFAVARGSIGRRLDRPLPIQGIVLDELRKKGLYARPTRREGPAALWDVISDAPMATEFAISRFLTPFLAQRGWALFVDCDVMAKADVGQLFDLADPDKAVMCVKHDFKPDNLIKMDGQMQTTYPRKNWSSVMLFNCDHPSNERLTVKMVNELRGRDLHGFCWLKDEEIGELDPKWNWLVGHSSPQIEPAIVHFTDGIPLMKGYEHVPFAEEWRMELSKWAA